MIARLDDMPNGTAGFLFSGEVTARDYEDVLVPALNEIFDSEEPVRVLCQLGPDFEGYEAGAVWADVKTGAKAMFGRHPNWHRIAVASDTGWVRHLMGVFGWMSPGEVKLFELSELDAAKEWVAG